ncbi:cytochrome d ubiquinol oxidase subunit II [Desulfovibrio aerotolerans]|uniref:Cytochrome d ubiquinol oxidase subunit II n=1 Tax=Solidesulfovibrio aerotolerans TaxID=295255 RepID=A0A7C9NHS5_9BACT|nr:cytochrome d ubiquinol oxidase subunit II [Solidesulfovibrio aerotolerans]MYL81996.1 cytochrome d ubiquinol oxidase subunit II [Solidesulfovibrio aerotolerans]
MDLGTIWFVLWGVLWAVYFIMDGFDLGIGSFMPFLAKNNEEKRIMYNAMGPFWDGNEVWLITAGGVTFAAFPRTYAVMFSALYTPLMLLLFALILRGVSFEFRSKVDSPGWRKLWDTCNFLGSFLPALLLGVAFANIFKGIPIDAEGILHGNLLTLLNPYGLAGGVLFVLLFAHHGALWLAYKSVGDLHDRAVALAGKLWPIMAGVIVLFLGMSFAMTKLFTNYLVNPILFVILLAAVAGLVLTCYYRRAGRILASWGASAVLIGTTALFGVVGIFPALLPSSLNPAFSLTIENSSSTPMTLAIMLGVALVFVPVVIAYQIWTLRTFRHPVTKEDLDYEEAY